MMVERKPLRGDFSGDMSPVTIHHLSEIKDAVQELKRSMPDSALAHLAERKIRMMESKAGENLGSGKDHLRMAARNR